MVLIECMMGNPATYVPPHDSGSSMGTWPLRFIPGDPRSMTNSVSHLGHGIGEGKTRRTATFRSLRCGRTNAVWETTSHPVRLVPAEDPLLREAHGVYLLTTTVGHVYCAVLGFHRAPGSRMTDSVSHLGHEIGEG